MKTKESTGNLIQGMRDCFGAHTVVMKETEEVRHIDWLSKDE
jgi:6-phosphogluconate dehydrogenase